MAIMAEEGIELELRRAVAAHRRRVLALEAAEEGRDEAVRRALAAGLTYLRVAEIAGISRQRVDQIRRGGRI